MEATPDPVKGVLGESANITWTLNKALQTDKVADTRLFLGNFTEEKLLYRGVNILAKQALAEEIFGDRIQAFFKEPHYTLTLSNLRFNDTFTFTLVVTQEIQGTITPRPAVSKSVTIIEVRGMCFL